MCVAPVSSMVQTMTKWRKESDINFVMADGVIKAPLGVADKFVFRISDKYFVVKVYIVDSANYQLLLGTEFMVTTGVGLFPRWGKIVLTIPARIEVDASCKRITAATGAPPLEKEENDELDEEDFEKLASVSMNYIGQAIKGKNLPLYKIGTSAIQVGMRDLVKEVEQPNDPPLEVPAELKAALNEGLPVLTVEFIEENLRFGPSVPKDMKLRVCQDVIDYADVFSWNQFDLGCMTDVPHSVSRWDPTPAIQASRRHLYNPINNKIITIKCWPLVELGHYRKAPPECIDRAQLTIVRKGLTDRNDPVFCRVAHDYRDYNNKIYLDPIPCDNINDMMAWMGESKG